MVVGLFRD